MLSDPQFWVLIAFVIFIGGLLATASNLKDIKRL